MYISRGMLCSRDYGVPTNITSPPPPSRAPLPLLLLPDLRRFGSTSITQPQNTHHGTIVMQNFPLIKKRTKRNINETSI